MTDSNYPELQELEPLDDGAPAASAAAPASDAMLVAMKSGLGPPAFNPSCTDKLSYKMLMASVLMALGCMMPFSADLAEAGYKTMGGAIFTFISLGMLWTWWGAIHNNRSTAASLKWLALAFVPFAVQVLNLIAYEPAVALDAAKAAGHLPAGAEISGWNTLFADIGGGLAKGEDAPAAAARVGNFFRCFGTGKILLMLGALLSELFFVMGIAGGAKQNKQQKLARQQAAQERKRR